MNGIITEIERFALNDGPGIRTVVFLKGCNMNCAWCHNPETIRSGRELHYYEKKCIRCYKCVYACPSKAHKRLDNVHRFFPAICVKCGKCADICYPGAMAVSGREMTVPDVMREILQDRLYYKNSGGGVTISGGEALCQPEFVQELTDACHSEGIKVGIETNLNFRWEEIEEVIDSLDLVMCDLKIADSEEHRKWTGVGNELIIESLHRLGAGKKPYIVRTPLIPGAADSEENISAIASIIKEADTGGALMYYELLNFNPLGAVKYESLQKKNPFEGVRPFPKERLKELAEAAGRAGIPVRIE